MFRGVGVSGNSVRQISGVDENATNEVFRKPLCSGAEPA
jgi:hypothetical protein